MNRVLPAILICLIIISCSENKKEQSPAKSPQETQKPLVLKPELLGNQDQQINQGTPNVADQQKIDNFNPKTADEVIAMHFQARGGIDKIRAIRTMKVTGTMMTMGQQVPYTMYYKRPNMMKMVIKAQNKEVIQAYDGKEGWVGVIGERIEAMPEQAAKEFQTKGDLIEGPLYDYKTKGIKISFAGKEKIGGQENFKLKVITPDKNTQWAYIDAKTFLMTLIRNQIDVGGKKQVIEMYVGDYKNVNGMMMSHLNETKVDGKVMASMKYDKIELDLKLENSVFAKPAK